MTAQATFAYKARDGNGEIVAGSMVAASAEEVSTKLRADGKFVLSVDENALRAVPTESRDHILRNQSAKRVRREDVITFAQQLSVMLETGVPLSEALDAFCEQTPSKDFKTVLHVLREDVYSGEPFSNSMAKWPRVFPTLMISLMKASEAAGNMAMMLGRVGDYLAKERRTARQIKGALAYPMFMVVAGFTMTVFLMTFVLPKFAKIYADRQASLPKPTKILLAVSDFMTSQYMYYVPVVVVLVSIGLIMAARPIGKRIIDWLRLNVPVLRILFGQLYVTRMARTMSTLLAAGVNLLDIIDISRGITNNTYYDEFWDQMEDDIRGGKQISDTVRETKLLPANVASMIASGERSGRLGEVMERIAEFTDEELDAAVKQVTSLIEPIMIIVMGFMVGGIAMALLLPIFSMGRVMTGG